jgi:hypothetical protein
VIGDNAAKNRVENMNKRDGGPQRCRFHVRLDEQEPAAVSDETIEIHELLLTLPSVG